MKTKTSPKINHRSDADHSQIIERMQMQTIGKLFGGGGGGGGGDAVELLGGIYSPIPRVSAPLINYQGVKMWNAIPINIRDQNFNKFKINFKNSLFEKYQR